MTPPDSSSALVSFAQRDVGKRLAPKLKAAGVDVTLYRNYFRVSPSFYNGSDDVERLIEALS
jgi:selenocysteine lyase/cysteine desulfurase